MTGNQPTIGRDDDPIVPDYAGASLAGLFPAAARALGVDTGLPALPLARASRVCVVLVDGLGARLLAQAGRAVAPFLTAALAASEEDVPTTGLPTVLHAGCPSTTATSLGTLGTGLPPGQHGMAGYQARDPRRGVLFNELRWDPYTDPLDWQPHPTIFERCVAAGVTVTRIGDPDFADSGLTRAVQRGGTFVGLKKLDDRVDAALAALAGPAPALTYLYWGGVDAAGHEHGWQSDAWRGALAELDAALGRLAGRLPADTTLLVTADHGMVDVPHTARLDIADRPELREDIAVFGGEPRMVQLYVLPGRTAAVAARLQDALGDRAWVRTRADAIDEGWFGPVDERVIDRFGDVLVAARGAFALVDRGVMHRKVLALIGHHGSLTADEQLVPLITVHGA